MQLDLGDTIDADRLKSSEADVQRDVGNLNAARADRREDVVGEMQARGRRGHGPAFAREDGLVAALIGLFVGPRDVGRQRHVAEAIERSIEVGYGGKAQGALAVFSARDHFSTQLWLARR